MLTVDVLLDQSSYTYLHLYLSIYLYLSIILRYDIAPSLIESIEIPGFDIMFVSYFKQRFFIEYEASHLLNSILSSRVFQFTFVYSSDRQLHVQ